jgi:hypothetical protein
MDVFELSRNFWNWCFENPEKIRPNHSAMYFFIIEHSNRLGWKDKFGLPMQMTMDAIGIKNYKTYSNTLSDLVDFGFVKIVEKSKNQYSATIIALTKNTKANTKALSKATLKHSQKQVQSTVCIDIPINQEPINNINISFDTFWNLYNKKQGDKEACEKKWIKLTDTDRQKIIDTLPLFLSKITDKQFQPLPATYLNQKRWNDEISKSDSKKRYNLVSANGRLDIDLTDEELEAKTKTGFWKIYG